MPLSDLNIFEVCDFSLREEVAALAYLPSFLPSFLPRFPVPPLLPPSFLNQSLTHFRVGHANEFPVRLMPPPRTPSSHKDLEVGQLF